RRRRPTPGGGRRATRSGVPGFLHSCQVVTLSSLRYATRPSDPSEAVNGRLAAAHFSIPPSRLWASKPLACSISVASSLRFPLRHTSTTVRSVERVPCSRTALWCWRSEEHTSELQSRGHLVCRLLLEKKNYK